MPKNRLYVGIVNWNLWQIFKSKTEPTLETHGDRYKAVIGPFRTMRGAAFMSVYGRGNPHCVCVNDAERLGKRHFAVPLANIAQEERRARR